jgi:hypothetical protein
MKALEICMDGKERGKSNFDLSAGIHESKKWVSPRRHPMISHQKQTWRLSLCFPPGLGWEGVDRSRRRGSTAEKVNQIEHVSLTTCLYASKGCLVLPQTTSNFLLRIHILVVSAKISDHLVSYTHNLVEEFAVYHRDYFPEKNELYNKRKNKLRRHTFVDYQTFHLTPALKDMGEKRLAENLTRQIASSPLSQPNPCP